MTWPGRGTNKPRQTSPKQDFGEVVLTHLDAAYSLARWLVRDPHLAEDIVQEAVLRGLSYFASFRGEDGRAWLMRIVRNTAYTMLATRRRADAGMDRNEALNGEAVLNLPDPGEGPDAALGRKEDTERLERALSALPVELRECLILKELEELSYKEIAQITGVPIGTVMSRLWRARRALIAGERIADDQ
ncbi:sigma-70 family RNA polymerase sigma factor [Roseomonas nepalensis]|uniref:RNA polymerase sigma factor n=1 Tax=Muricoccus nepalensis TaxID=1854500 RepID=A0A502G1T2_9PROT|nr:sigma-70 family RNA polymerase sigma factor [Roseomonas nepalensis]TPG55704.1 sigma-70 family RNA polymerase sigma factor [Roseomonas nepalensis]